MTIGLRFTLCLLLVVLVTGCGARNGQRTLRPQQAKASFQEGEAAYHLGMYQNSHECFMAAETAGHQPGPSLINAGASLLAMRQFAQALPLLERATREYPTATA